MDKAPSSWADTHVTSAASYNAIIWTLLALILLTTAVRMYCRARVFKALGVDDWLILAATILAIIYTAFHHVKQMFWYPVIDRLVDGKGIKSIRSDSLQLDGERYLFLAQFVYPVVLGLFKASIFVFYLRFVTIKSQRIFIQVMLVLVALVSLLFFILNFVAYKPLAAYWDQSIINRGEFKIVISALYREIAHTAVNIAFDLILLALPVVIFRRVQIPTAKKILLVVIYAFGFVSLAATIARLPPTVQLKNSFLGGNPVLTYQRNITFTLWTQVELATGIICANIPALSAFLRNKAAQFSSWRSSSRSHSTSKLRPDSGSSKRAYLRQMSEDSTKGLSAAENGNSVIMRDVDFSVDYELPERKAERV